MHMSNEDEENELVDSIRGKRNVGIREDSKKLCKVVPVVAKGCQKLTSEGQQKVIRPTPLKMFKNNRVINVTERTGESNTQRRSSLILGQQNCKQMKKVEEEINGY